MLFVELRFFAFFAVVFAATWALQRNTHRKWLLTFSSYFFYGVWDWRFLSLILLITLVSFATGEFARKKDPKDPARRLALRLGIVSSLLVLGVFKYFNFFADSFADTASMFGLNAGRVTLDIVLPVGISFYTFQAISYMVDVHRGQISAKRHFLDVAFYIAFFPQLVAGPIVRASNFIPQMDAMRRWADVNVKACLTLFLIGFIKKACISDNIAPYVDLVFDNPEAFTAPSVVAGVFLYGVQIYCDFSGYSDMAIACAGLLGYKFPANFRSPYLSADIQQFWRRWHISLSSWLRDYLYIPLGGNRNGHRRRDINLMTTMVLGGLWHGASFNFVIWGFLHGTALMIERTWSDHVASKLPSIGALGPLLGGVLTFYWVNLAWIFFRAPTLTESVQMSVTYLTWQSPGMETLPINPWPLLALLAAVHWLGDRYDGSQRFSAMSARPYALALGLAAAAAISFVPTGYRPFIYFQF